MHMMPDQDIGDEEWCRVLRQLIPVHGRTPGAGRPGCIPAGGGLESAGARPRIVHDRDGSEPAMELRRRQRAALIVSRHPHEAGCIRTER